MHYVPVSPRIPSTGWVPYPLDDAQREQTGGSDLWTRPPRLFLTGSRFQHSETLESELYAYNWSELNPDVGIDGTHSEISCSSTCPSKRHGREYISDDRWPEPTRRQGATRLEFRSSARPTAIDAYVWPLTFAEHREYRPPKIDDFYQRIYSSAPGRFHWASFLDIPRHRAPYPALAYKFLRWKIVFDRFAWTRDPRDVRDIVRLSSGDLEATSSATRIHMLPHQQADVEYILVSVQWNDIPVPESESQPAVGVETSAPSNVDLEQRANVGAVWLFHFENY